jgi:hypothetical protein
MAKLTISDAARVAGVARSTLHRAMHAGRLSVDADGRVDTSELLRAGYTLHGATHQSHAPALQDATFPRRDTQQTHTPAETQGVLALQQERDLLRLERDLLRRELDAAQTREQVALAREQEARDERQAVREREALLLRMVEQMQHRYDRLLEAPQQPPAPTAVPHHTAAGAADRGEIRRRIVALLQDHPEGLSPTQVRQHLTVDKPLTNTMAAMVRDGLLQRVAPGRYVTNASPHT